MKKNKKAQMKLLRYMIAFLAVTLVLIAFYFMVIPFFQELSDKEGCRLSVAAKYGGKAATLGFSETRIALQCYTQTVTIREDGIYKRGRERKGREIEDFGGLRNDEKIEKVKMVVAGEMYDCWDQFWKGKLAIFTTGRRCVICSEIIFEPGWLDSKGPPSIVLGEFLNTQKILGQDQTYADFFGGRFESNFAIDTRTKTVVNFKAVAQSWWEKIKHATFIGCTMGGGGTAILYGAGALLAVPGAGVALAPPTLFVGGGCVVGGIIGTGSAIFEGEKWIPTMVVGPSAVVAEKCDRLY